MLTSSLLSTPRLTWETSGLGVPNRMSERSVAIIEPPQPSRHGGAQRLVQDVLRVLVVAHVGAVQDVDHFPVDAPRHQLRCSRQSSCASGGARFDHRQLTGLLAEHGEAGVGDIEGDLVGFASVGGDAQLGGQAAQLERIADLCSPGPRPAPRPAG